MPAHATSPVRWMHVLLLGLALAGTAQAREVGLLVVSNLDDWTFAGGQPVDGGTLAEPANDNVHILRNDDVAWWSMTYQFVLPADATNFALNLFYLAADDRAVLSFNDVPIISVGIGGPGAGLFRATADGADQRRAFARGNGELTGSITMGQVTWPGVNRLTLTINNTNAGITGATAAAGPSSAVLAATLKYTTQQPASAVPEPAAWLLALGGLAGMGAWRRLRQCRGHMPAG